MATESEIVNDARCKFKTWVEETRTKNFAFDSTLSVGDSSDADCSIDGNPKTIYYSICERGEGGRIREILRVSRIYTIPGTGPVPGGDDIPLIVSGQTVEEIRRLYKDISTETSAWSRQFLETNMNDVLRPVIDRNFKNDSHTVQTSWAQKQVKGAKAAVSKMSRR